jgi:vancomycin permeability regulator SanA
MADRRKRASAYRRLGRLMAVLVAGFFATSWFVQYRYAKRLVSASAAPSAPVALVFGAGLAAGQEPSPLLAQRLDTAIALYRSGKVSKVLVSGDNLDRHHDEPAAMRRYAIGGGVSEKDVLVDDAGVSTYASCARAKLAYGVDRALLITQHFHLPRALFIANSLGIDAWGVPADAGQEAGGYYLLRELFSRPLALAMVIARPEPQAPPEP